MLSVLDQQEESKAELGQCLVMHSLHHSHMMMTQKICLETMLTHFSFDLNGIWIGVFFLCSFF